MKMITVNQLQAHEIPAYVTECPCEACGSFLMETDYSDWDDCYTLHCSTCKKDIRLHYTGYDAWRDSIADAKKYEAEACELVKMLHKHCNVLIGIKKVDMDNIRSIGKHIQTLEMLDDTNEYYELNGEYYFFGLNSGVFRPKSDADFQVIIEYILKKGVA